MPNYERKPIERILAERRKARDPSKRADADELIGDVDLDVPMNAPERDTVKVLGSPEDERSVNGGYGEGNTEGEGFTGRYGKRDTNAGPEGLTTNVMSDVAADDPRVQKEDFSFGAPEPSKPTRESAATGAMFDYDKAQSWGGEGGYNYYYEPSPSGGVGVLTAEGPDGKRVAINPRTASGQTTGMKDAWLAIFDERFKQGEAPRPTQERAPSRATTDGTEEPSSAEQDEVGLTTDAAERANADAVSAANDPKDRYPGEIFPGDTRESLPEEDIYAGAEQSPPADEEPGESPSEPAVSEQKKRPTVMEASTRAYDGEYGPGNRKSSDVGGQLFDAVTAPRSATSREDVRTSQKAHEARTAEAADAKRRERAEKTAGLPDRKDSDIGGQLQDRLIHGPRDAEAEDDVHLADLYEQLMGSRPGE